MEKIRCVACFNSLVDLWGEGQTEGISRIFFTPFFVAERGRYSSG